MREPSVSVIVPVYNVENYLRQCLDSLVHQTLQDLEIIVVNDGSTDGSPSIAREYEQRYSNVRVFDQENQGLSGARNTGMKHARGQYIGLLDSDDWACLDMFESLYARAVRDASDLVIADAKVARDDTQSIDAFFDRALWNELPEYRKNAPFRLADEPRVLLLEPAAWKRLYKRSFLERIGFEFAPGLIFEDVPAHFALLSAANSISLLDKPVCFYRMGRPGKITTRRDRTLFQVFDIFDLAQNALRSSGADPLLWALYVKVQMRFCSWLFLQVTENDRADFFDRWAAQFRRVPRPGFQRHAREFPAVRERLLTLCVCKGWFSWFNTLVTRGATMPMKLYCTVRYWPQQEVFTQIGKRVQRLLGLATNSSPRPTNLRSVPGEGPELRAECRRPCVGVGAPSGPLRAVVPTATKQQCLSKSQ